MEIADSRLQLAGRHHALQRTEHRERLTIWRDAGALSSPERPRDPARSADLSAQARATQPRKAALPEEGEAPRGPFHEAELAILKGLIERLTGREMRVFDPSELREATGDAEAAAEAVPEGPARSGEDPEREGWGLVYDHYTSRYEKETAAFAARGIVHTADGQRVEVAIELAMSREFLEQEHIELRAGDALKDPLVVNFGGTAAELTERRFAFDLDADGRKDQIAFVDAGSGFLALDRNRDGKVNDGSELFGPDTGNGYTELAALDDDGNGWIDAADPVYERLRVWSKDPEGHDRLVALGERGIGALYLGHVDTPFLIKDADNATLGAVRETGLFLGEDGGTGTLQRLDLVV